jgi:hypothetical protein
VAQNSHKTVQGSADQAEISSGEILTPPLAREQDPTVEEIILVRSENSKPETEVHDAQTADDPAPDRLRRKAQPSIVERPIDTIYLDSRYGSLLCKAEAFRRVIPRLNILSEEGVRQLCSALRIRVSMIDGRYFAFGGMLSFTLAHMYLSGSREITVELYDEVSDRDVLAAAFFDQVILLALMQSNDQIETWQIAMLLNAQKQRPEIFAQDKKTLIESFGRSPRDFRSKFSRKKPIREAEDAA